MMNRKQTLLWIFLAFVGLAMLAGLVAIVMPQRYVNDQVIATIMTVGMFSLGGLIVLAIGREMKITTRIAIVTAVVSLASFISLIWFERSMRGSLEDNFYKVGFSGLILALVCTHRLLIVPLEGRNTWGHLCKRTAIISAGCTGGAVVLFLMVEGFWGWEDLMVRAMGVGLLVTAGSSIGAGAIALFGPKPGEDDPELVAESIAVEMRCPVCSNNIEVRSNRDGHCGHCNLQIRINTSELRCECGYTLHQIESEICPECGTAVDAGERWGGPGAGVIAQ